MFLAKTIIFPPKISLKLSATTFCSNLVDRFTDKTQYKKNIHNTSETSTDVRAMGAMPLSQDILVVDKKR